MRYSIWVSGTLIVTACVAGCADKADSSAPTGGSAGMTPGSAGAAPAGGTASAGAGGSASSSGGGVESGGGPVAVGGTNGSAGGAGTGSGGAPACPAADGLKITRLTTTSIAMMGKPFDTDSDKTTPWNFSTNYGVPPEIVALPDGESVDILWQDHAADPARNQADPNKNAKKAFVVRVEKGASGYAVTRAYQFDQLAHIMGFAKDEQGNYFVATGVDEDSDLTPEVPGPGMHRPGITKIVKFDGNGCKLLEIDVDNERAKLDPKSEPVINPMVAATSRLAYQKNRLAFVHGINVDYDSAVMARHQKAMTTHLDATTGAATLVSSMWVSHSFDQRLFYDGSGFVEVHLGDAYPRSIALGRFNDKGDKTNTKTYELFRPKGELGDNNTFTRLGGVAQIEAGDLGYVVAFTTERGLETTSLLNGTRDLAFLRVSRGFAGMSEMGNAFVDGATTQDVTSAGEAASNKLTWLTDYAADTAQADRPRLASIGGDQFVVLWEKWTGSDKASTFAGTQGLLLSGDGTVKVMPKAVLQHHLTRGDDVVRLGSQALFVSGDGAAKKLTLNLIAADLTVTSVDLP